MNEILRDGCMFLFGVLTTLAVVAVGAWRINVHRRRHYLTLMTRLGRCYEATTILGIQIRRLGRLWGIVVESDPLSSGSQGDDSHESGQSGRRRAGAA